MDFALLLEMQKNRKRKLKSSERVLYEIASSCTLVTTEIKVIQYFVMRNKNQDLQHYHQYHLLYGQNKMNTKQLFINIEIYLNVSIQNTVMMQEFSDILPLEHKKLSVFLAKRSIAHQIQVFLLCPFIVSENIVSV